MFYVNNKWIYGCFDVEEKLGYIQYIINDKNYVNSDTKSHFIKSLEKIDLELKPKKCDQSPEILKQNVKNGDDGFIILGLIFEQFVMI